MSDGVAREKRGIVRDMAAFIAGGMSGAEATETIVKIRHDAGFTPISRSALYKYLELAYRRIEKEAAIEKPRLAAISQKTYRKTVRAAFTRQKTVFVDGVEKKVLDPDFGAVIAAQSRLDKITGIDVPEINEMMAAQAHALISIVIEALRLHIEDASKRSQIVGWISDRMDRQQIESGASLALPTDVKVIEQKKPDHGSNGVMKEDA